jgi:hypothetical protein
MSQAKLPFCLPLPDIYPAFTLQTRYGSATDWEQLILFFGGEGKQKTYLFGAPTQETRFL